MTKKEDLYSRNLEIAADINTIRLEMAKKDVTFEKRLALGKLEKILRIERQRIRGEDD